MQMTDKSVVMILWVPLEQNGDDSTSVNTNLFPGRLSHIEMLKRRIAPAAVVAWKSKVRRAEVCGSDGNRSSFYAPPGISLIITHDSVALSAWSSIIEQCSAQSSGTSSIPSWIQVSVPASSPCSQAIKSYVYENYFWFCYFQGIDTSLVVKLKYPLFPRHRFLHRTWHEL